MRKRIICLVLALFFAISAFPQAGFAAKDMDPILVQDGDSVTLHDGWVSVQVPDDGLYRLALPQSEDSGGVYAVYQIPEDTSGYSEDEIQYIKQDLRIFVYDLMLQSARESVESAENSMRDSLAAHDQAVQDHEAARRSYNLQSQYREQIENLITHYREVEKTGRAPLGFFSVQDYYLRSVRPRLLAMGFAAPEDSTTLWKAYLDSLEWRQAFEQAEKELPRFEERYQQAVQILDNAKQELSAFEQECAAAHTEYEQAKAKLNEPYPNTDDYLLLNWGYVGFDYQSLHNDSCYWLMKDGMGKELSVTVSLLSYFRDDNEWPQKLSGMYFENGTYALVVRSDGEQRTYYNGLLMETTPDENGVVTVPETVNDTTITEIGANAFHDNDSITAVYIPATVTRIQTGAFHDCDQLKDIYYDGTQEDWNAIHISSGNESLEAAVLHVKDSGEPDPSVTPDPDSSESPDPTPSVTPEAKLPFTDVPKTAWFYPNVVSVWEQGVMKGQKNDVFAPFSTTTRAEFATVIFRIAKGTSPAKESSFVDVKKTDWFHDAVTWAFENGIVKGIDASHFDPYAPVTREQMVTMLCRYASGKGNGSNLSGFKDVDQINDYAKLPISWAVEQKIITGSNQGTINPQGNATRAEMAAVLDRYLSK